MTTMAPVGLRTRTPWLLCLGPPPGPCCPLSPTNTRPHTPTARSPHRTMNFHLIPLVGAVPAASTVRAAGAVGRPGVMGGQGAQGGPRSGPPSPSPAVAVSPSPPAEGAAFGGVGNQVGLAMGALLHPEAQLGVPLISEPTRGSILMDHPLAWPSPTTP